MNQAGGRESDLALSRRQLIAGAATAAGAATVGSTISPLAAGAQTRPTLKRSVKPPPELPTAGPIYARHANPADLGVLEAASLLQAGLLSSKELTTACQKRIDERNGALSFDGSSSEINAWIRTYPELAQHAAKAADVRLVAARKAGSHKASPLTGVPLALKDLYAVKGLPVTASSNVLGGAAATGVNASAGNIASGDSTAWKRLDDAGMVLLGHTHSDEFAFLAVTPQCGNPWDTSLITGGSSGGSAAALGSRMTTAAMGSDTLGSLRIPAAFCGASSIKPTFGLLSTYGVIPLAWSLDVCGPMARSAGDCALMLSALAGADPNDPSTDIGQRPPSRYPTLPRKGARPLKGTRIGVPTNLGTPDGGPAQVVARTYSELRALGATLVELAVPEDPFSTSIGPLEFYTDALSFHGQWFPSEIEKYKSPAAQMLTLITSLNLSALDYLSLQRRRAEYQTSWKQTLADNDLDAVAFLVSLSDPPARDNPELASPVTNPENSRLLTFIFSYIGFPVVTIPGGTSTATKLPVGIQIGGAPFTESRLIQLAVDLQHHYPHYEEAPSFK